MDGVICTFKSNQFYRDSVAAAGPRLFSTHWRCHLSNQFDLHIHTGTWSSFVHLLRTAPVKTVFPGCWTSASAATSSPPTTPATNCCWQLLSTEHRFLDDCSTPIDARTDQLHAAVLRLFMIINRDRNSLQRQFYPFDLEGRLCQMWAACFRLFLLLRLALQFQTLSTFLDKLCC